jgi:N-acetylneuraminate synthase
MILRAATNMTIIIAEAGVNHNGDEKLAFKLIDAAHYAGADIVKFQTFKAKNLVTKNAKQAVYQLNNTEKAESQFDMLSRLELSFDSHHRLIDHCNNLGIEFLSTAFDSESLAFLVDELGLKRLKIPSGEITNAPLVLEHARTGCDLIVSTGMATLSEVETVLGVIAFGYLNDSLVTPTVESFEQAFASIEGQKLLTKKVTLLHCTTEYPAPFNEINLKAMDTLAVAFNLPVGYSDHSNGISIPIAAVARGAVLIEKHFTLNKQLPGPDHKASLEPTELIEMIQSIRNTEAALGNGLKVPQKSEIKNKIVARKSIIAKNKICKGELFTAENITIKRPGSGMSPLQYWTVIGELSKKTFEEGDEISV